MKKLLACLFAIIILAFNVVPCYAANASLGLSSNDYSVSMGDTVTISVGLSANSNLSTLTFDVQYNPSQFEYVAGSASAGNQFGGFYDFNVMSAGLVRFTFTTETAVTAGGTIASMRFRALTDGGRFSVKVVEAVDLDYNAVHVSTSSITLSCSHARMVWETERASTCTRVGLESGACTCGYTTTRENPKSAHTYTSSTIKKEATCTSAGVEVGTCTVCGETGAESKIPAKGHSFTDWVVTQEPTADTMGIKARSCLNCGETQTQMIPTKIEGITDDDLTGEHDSSTEPPTAFEPIEEPDEPSNNYYEIPTESTTQPQGIFGNATGSDIAIIVVIALAVLVVIILVLYIVLIIKQKKR